MFHIVHLYTARGKKTVIVPEGGGMFDSIGAIVYSLEIEPFQGRNATDCRRYLIQEKGWETAEQDEVTELVPMDDYLQEEWS